jgi:hypothetical protein
MLPRRRPRCAGPDVNFFVDGSSVHQESIPKSCLFEGDGPCGTGMLGAVHTCNQCPIQASPQGDSTVLAETHIALTE